MKVVDIRGEILQMKRVNVKDRTIKKTRNTHLRVFSNLPSGRTFYQQVQFPIHLLVYMEVRNVLRSDLQEQVSR